MSEQIKKKKYNINLPKTSFPMKASLATREPERLKRWKKDKTEQSVLDAMKQGEKSFVLHDGPPYANGHIHIGHALNKILKDMIVRHKFMTGHKTKYVPGWDCHGLPIEHQCLKEMGKKKDEVELTEFRKQARKYASKFVKIQKEEFKRLGIFGEWEAPYLTMSKTYQTSIVKSFWKIFEAGYVEQHLKPVPWCYECETALADAELEYSDRTDAAIFVSFPIDENDSANKTLYSRPGLAGKKISALVWTTTPWTLPANVGLAFNEELVYVVCETDKGVYLFAQNLLETLKEKMGWAKADVLYEFTPKVDGLSIEADHPFLSGKKSKSIFADYVLATDGTGIVHIAPGHGEDDYHHGFRLNKLDIVSPVNPKGAFFGDDKSGFVEMYPKFKDVLVFKANKMIIELLEAKGRLSLEEPYTHSYPNCWRCKSPILYRATPQWFMKVDHKNLRAKLTDEIQNKIKFTPDWGKNRIGSMVETRPDWCLSRQRLWGVPIPLAKDKQSGKPVLDEAFKKRALEIFEKEGADAWFEKPEAFTGGDANLELETDILDVWFDSGVSHQAVLKTDSELGFPSSLYLEGSDQHRGWFQTSLITSMALEGRSPFDGVLTHGFVVDAKGKKMSKSLGNVVSPQEVMTQYGADILRLWVSSCDTDNDIRMSPEILERLAEAYRKIRNSFRFLLGNMNGFDPKAHTVPFEKMDSIDQWILSRLNEVADEVTKGYESFQFHKTYQTIYDFCINDLSSFYLDALKDRFYCDAPDNSLRRSSQSALHIIAKSLCQLLAPILVFTSEEIWEVLTENDGTSIHQYRWDASLWNHKDGGALRHWNAVRAIRKNVDSVIERMREQKEVGSSLDCCVSLHGTKPEIERFLKENKHMLSLGLIVSEVKIENPAKADIEFDLAWIDPAGKERTDRIIASVHKAAGNKCARCWKVLPEVSDSENGALCKRCADVENSLGSV